MVMIIMRLYSGKRENLQSHAGQHILFNGLLAADRQKTW